MKPRWEEKLKNADSPGHERDIITRTAIDDARANDYDPPMREGWDPFKSTENRTYDKAYADEKARPKR